MAADEEELEQLEEKERLEGSAKDGGVLGGVEGVHDDTGGLFGAAVKKEVIDGGRGELHMAGKKGGGWDTGLVKGEMQEAAEGVGVKVEQIKTEMEEVVGVQQEMELDGDAFSDDDLL